MGASALSTEFLCLDVRSKTLKQWLPKMNELCGFDIMAFYKKYSVQHGYLRLNRKIKEPFFNNMRDTCLEVGMRFYVSDAHFKEMCANGSCCGLPTNWNYSRGQFCEALQIAKKTELSRTEKSRMTSTPCTPRHLGAVRQALTPKVARLAASSQVCQWPTTCAIYGTTLKTDRAHTSCSREL